MLELLAAGITRMSVDESAVEAMQGIAGSPISKYPQLFSDENRNPVWKNDKTGVRMLIRRCDFNDILTQPRRGDRNFLYYFNLFRIEN